MMRLVCACVCVALGAAPEARGASAGEPGPGAAAPVIATRAEVARAYIRFEIAYAAKAPAPGRERSVMHRKFDDLTGAFFGGDNAKAARELDRLTSVLDAGAPVFGFPARVGLVVEEPDDGMLIQALSDPARLAGEVEAEVAAIEAGRDPYRRRLGDWWMAVHVADGVEMPARVFAPSAASFERRPPLPLVIALHGAGGDENLFMEAYGRGKIKALAEEHGFVVASVSTTMLAGQPGALDALLADLRAHYGLDERRVYVVGHSMGAGAAALLAATRREMIAGVVCIAGGPQRVPTGPVAPMLVWGAELDTMISAGRLRGAAEGARAAGLAVEYREAAGAGHVLVVGDVLAEAVKWLLKQGGADGAGGGRR